MESKDIRNLALVGHGGVGKTSLSEAILLKSGSIGRLGRVEDGNTVCDFEPEEPKHSMSITTAVASFAFKDTKINLLDAPGYVDFTGEARSALRVCENALFIVSAVSGVEVQTEIFWDYANSIKNTRFIFINKMDRENANWDGAIQSIDKTLGSNAVPVLIPIGSADNFSGIIDLINMKAIISSGRKSEESDIPDDLIPLAEKYRDNLIDKIADKDDQILEKYLDGQQLTNDDIIKTLNLGITDGSVVPVLCGSAINGIGIDFLLNFILNFFVSPDSKESDKNASASAFIFKTTADPFVGKLSLLKVYSGTLRSDSSLINANKDKPEKIGQLLSLFGKKQANINELIAGDIGAVAKLSISNTSDTLCQKDNLIKFEPIQFPDSVLSHSIKAKSKVDEEKLSTAIARILEEDSTLKINREAELQQTIISGTGEIHLDVIKEKLKRKFGVEAEYEPMKIPFRETIKGTAKAQGKYKKQSGGRGQYGDCWIEISPLGRGEGFKFVDKIFGGSIPQNFRPAVEKGIKEAMLEGVMAGYHIVDLQVILYDGSFHPVDSSEMAFKIAGSLALKNAIKDAKPVLIEPVSAVEVIAPDQHIGDIIGDLNSRRGKVLGMEPIGSGKQIVKANVPTSEMSKYSIDLRSISHGRASFKMTPSFYDEVPSHLTEKIISASRKGASND